MSRPLSKLPEAELDVMLILWKTPGSARVLDIYNALQSVRPCSKPAIHTLLDRLEKRGFVKQETVDAPIPYKKITPVVTESEYRAAESNVFLDKLCRGSWKTLIATLIDTGRISTDDLTEITELLNSGKRK